MRQPRIVVITDLDGTLLDQATYSYRASLPAIRELLRREIPLILCSSKTYSEVRRLWQELNLRDPFIVENGGAIFSPARYFPFPLKGARRRDGFGVIELGTKISIVRAALMGAARECGVQVRSFGAMSPDEVSALTGLSKDDAALALQREYDEPFLVGEGDWEGLVTALTAKGFALTQGSGFFHITGNHDKGKAVKILLNLYRRNDREVLSVGLGNSANDFPLLNQVDRPILIRNADGSWDPEVMGKNPAIEITQESGPRGWREAIETVLSKASI